MRGSTRPGPGQPRPEPAGLVDVACRGELLPPREVGGKGGGSADFEAGGACPAAGRT